MTNRKIFCKSGPWPLTQTFGLKTETGTIPSRPRPRPTNRILVSRGQCGVETLTSLGRRIPHSMFSSPRTTKWCPSDITTSRSRRWRRDIRARFACRARLSTTSSTKRSTGLPRPVRIKLYFTQNRSLRFLWPTLDLRHGQLRFCLGILSPGVVRLYCATKSPYATAHIGYKNSHKRTWLLRNFPLAKRMPKLKHCSHICLFWAPKLILRFGLQYSSLTQ